MQYHCVVQDIQIPYILFVFCNVDIFDYCDNIGSFLKILKIASYGLEGKPLMNGAVSALIIFLQFRIHSDVRILHQTQKLMKEALGFHCTYSHY